MWINPVSWATAVELETHGGTVNHDKTHRRTIICTRDHHVCFRVRARHGVKQGWLVATAPTKHPSVYNPPSTTHGNHDNNPIHLA